MVKELMSMDLPIEDVYYDYKLIADSITDDESFQKADTGILLSHLYDVVKALEKQIPKEPFRISGIDVNDNAMVDCPICKAGNETSIKTIKHIYCWNCGQALEWE